MDINSDSNGSVNTGLMVGMVAAVLLMVVLLSLLAGMVMDISIIGNMTMYALWAGAAVSAVSLALMMRQ